MEGGEAKPAEAAPVAAPPDPEKQAFSPAEKSDVEAVKQKVVNSLEDWEDLDHKEIECWCSCPCTYASAVMTLLILMAFNLVLFAIVPLASVNTGWIYWSTDSIFGYYDDYSTQNGVTMNLGWYKGSIDFLYNGSTQSISNLLEANGTANVPQALGTTCGSLAAVSTALSLVYLLLFIAMMMPLRRWCWTVIKAFPPVPRCGIALLLGAAIISLTCAYFAEVYDYFQDRVDAIYEAHGSLHYQSVARPWVNYAWVFFLLGGISWWFFGLLSLYIPTPPAPRKRRA